MTPKPILESRFLRRATATCGALLISATGTVAQVAPTPVSSDVAPASLLAAFSLHSGTVQELSLPAAGRSAFSVRVVLDGQERTLALRPNDLLADGFQLLVDNGTGAQPVSDWSASTFRGTVLGAADSDVAASLRDGQLQAFISVDGETWAIEPVRKVDAEAESASHVVYSSNEVVQPNILCGVVNDSQSGAAGAGGLGGAAVSAASITIQECEIALDCDNAFYQSNGSNVQATMDAASSILNAVDVIYRRDVAICYSITTIIVRTSPVYTSGPDVGCGLTPGLLSEMEARWQANHTGVARDIAQLLSGQGTLVGTVGCASVGVICDDPVSGSGYGVSRANVSGGNLVTSIVILAHELGHNWSAQHCDATPPCDIMCASGCAVPGPIGFGSTASAMIIAHRDSRTCLGTCSGCQDSATTSVFGSGCAGSGTGSGPGCVSNNFNMMTPGAFFTQAFDIALLANSGASLRDIVSVDFFCRAIGSPITLPVQIYDRDPVTGRPGTVLGSGTMNVGASNAVYTATFSPSVGLPANTDFFIAFDNPGSTLVSPFASSGSTSEWYAFFGGSWSAQTPDTWNFRVNCVGAGASPVLSYDGTPSLGGNFSVTVSNARPNSNAALFWAATPVAFDLAVINAPGCFLYVDGVFLSQNTTTNAMGEVVLPFSVPASSTLCGITFLHQMIVIDPPANMLQAVTTRRGTMVFGN